MWGQMDTISQQSKTEEKKKGEGVFGDAERKEPHLIRLMIIVFHFSDPGLECSISLLELADCRIRGWRGIEPV